MRRRSKRSGCRTGVVAGLAVAACFSAPRYARAADESNVTSTAVSQNFDSIGTNAPATLPTGFKMTAAGGGDVATWTNAANLTATAIASSNGSPTTGGRYNWGATGGTDRAIGFMTSGSYLGPNGILAGFTNNVGNVVTQIVASMVLENYRINTAGLTNVVYFSTNGTTWGAHLASNVMAGGTSAYGFPRATNVVSFTVPSLSIAAGGAFYFLVNCRTPGANGQGIGLDNLSLTLQMAAVPTLTSPTATAIGQTNATLGANVTTNGGAALTARGTVWGTAATPTGNELAEGNTTTGVFTHVRTGLSQGTKYYFRGYATNSAGTGYSPDGSFHTEPGQASSVVFSNPTTNGMRISWTAGANSDGAIAVVRESTSPADPTDGTLHAASATFGGGADLGSGSYVVYRGSGTQVDATGLTPEHAYVVEVLAYKGTNANSGVDQGINYRQTSPAAGSRRALSLEPTAHASNLTFSAVGETQMTISWANGNGASRIVMVREGEAVDWTPPDGTEPSGVSTNFSSATDQTHGNKICYDGSATNFTLTGLTGATTYYVTIVEYNGSSDTYNYLTSGTPLAGSQATAAPCVPGAVAQAPVQTNQFDAKFTAGTAGMTNDSDAMQMWADGTGGYAAAWKTFRTTSGTAGTARPLQIGDEFSLDLTTYGVYYGQLGLSLNRSGSTGSWANRTNGMMASVRQDGENYGSGGGVGSWYAADSGTASFTNAPAGKSDFTVKFKITSSETYSVDLNGTAKYDRTFAGAPGTNDRIDAYALFLNDDRYDADDNRMETQWRTATVTNLGVVEFGADGGTRTISGMITDGLYPACTNEPSPNRLVKSGAGTVELACTNNTYTLDTEISGGTLAISADGCLGTPPGSVSNAHIKLINGATLGITNSFTLNANRGITISGGNATFDVATSKTNVYNGVITDGAESRGIIKDNGGYLRLGGNNAYDGGTYVKGGDIEITHGNALGTGPIYLGGTGMYWGGVVLRIQVATTLTNSITVQGNVSAVVGAISAIETATLSGPVALNAYSEFASTTNTALTVSGTMSGSGTNEILIAGSGTTVFSGTNTHNGQVTIHSGTLSISASRNLGEDPAGPYTNKIDLDGGALKATASFTIHSNYWTRVGGKNGVIAVDPACILTYPAAISGPGKLTKTGFGTLRLTGANTFTNRLTVDAGTVQIGNHGTAGSLAAKSIANDAALVWSRSDDATYAGAISGAGTLAQVGAGTLTLSGTNTYDGATAVDAGTLVVSGSIANSTVTVESDATLMGDGPVGPLDVLGTADPGMTAGGRTNLACFNLHLNAGGAMRVDVGSATGTAGTDWDLITAEDEIVVNSSGTFTIDLAGTPTGFDAKQGYSWKIMAGGSVADFDADRFAVDTNDFLAPTDGGTFSVVDFGNEIYLNYAPRVPAAPTFSVAPASVSSMALSFTNNANADPVVIVYDLDGSFTTPTGAVPAPGNAFAGGTVVCTNGASPQTHAGLDSCTHYYYKAWSYNGTNYSATGMADDDTTLSPGAPTGLYANPTNYTDFTANWSASAGASGYRLDVSTLTNFGGAGGASAQSLLASNMAASAAMITNDWSGWQLSGAAYVIMTNSASVITSAAFSTAGFTNLTVDFRSRSYGSVAGTARTNVTVSISTNNGTDWTVIGVVAPTNAVLNAVPTLTNTANLGHNQTRIRWQTLSAASGGGVGVSNLVVRGWSPAFVPGYSNLAVAGTSQSVTGLTDNTTYYYRLRTEGAGDCTSANSATNSVTTKAGPPLAPTGLDASDGTSTAHVALVWNDNPTETGYVVWRSTSSDTNTAAAIRTNAANATNYNDAGAAPGQLYWYWATATNEAGRSPLSASNSGWRALSAPAGVSASDGTYSTNVLVSWSDVDGETGYSIWRNTVDASGSATNIGLAAQDATFYSDTMAVLGTVYYYWVKATNSTSASQSAFSNGDSGYAGAYVLRYSGFEGTTNDNWSWEPTGAVAGELAPRTNNVAGRTGSYSLLVRGTSPGPTEDHGILFDNVALPANCSGIALSVGYAAGWVGASDDLYLDLSYDNGATWASTVQLVAGGSPYDLDFGETNALTLTGRNPYVANIPDDTAQVRVRIRFDAAATGNNLGDYCLIDELKLVAGCNLPTVKWNTARTVTNEESGTISIPATISAAADATVRVAIAGTALPGGTDFTATTTNLVFTAGGSTTVDLELALVDDAAAEGTESVLFTLTQAAGCRVAGPDAHKLLVRDDDGFALATANLASGTVQVNGATAYGDAGQRLLQALAPDIVAIQEWVITNASYRAFVDANFGTDYHCYVEPEGDANPIPNGVISRWPIVVSNEWADANVTSRDFIHVKIDLPGAKDLDLVCVNFKSGDAQAAAREAEARALTNYVAAAAFGTSNYLAIAGAMNLSNRTETALAVLTNLASDVHRPTDKAGSTNTNPLATRPYDLILPSVMMELQYVGTSYNGTSFPDGFIFDTREWGDHSYPALAMDSAAATNMTHRAVVKVFTLHEVTAPPASFTATAVSATQIDLAFQTNAAGDNVAIAFNTSGSFTTPTGAPPALGEAFAGGTLIYAGTGSSFSHTGLTACTRYYYQAWSYSATPVWSSGLTDDDTTAAPAAPAAVWATATNYTGFTANWTASAGASGYYLDVSTNTSGGAAIVPAVQGFEGGGGDNWGYSAIGAVTTASRKRSGAYSLQFTGATASATFDPIALSGTGPSWVTVAFSASGPDLNEVLYLSICTYEGGVLSSNAIQLVNGYGNADVAFNATNAANPTTVSPNPYTVAVSATATQVYLVAYAVGLDSGESYYIDDVTLTTCLESYAPGYSNRPVTGTSQSVTGLLDNTTYYFVVRAAGDTCTSANSPTGTMTTWAPPASFAATAVGVAQIDLAFQTNASGHDVAIAFNTSGSFTTPTGAPPALGEAFAGGTLIYAGTGSGFSHTGLTSCTRYYYQAWSYSGTPTVWSSGLADDDTTAVPAAPAAVWASETNYADFTAAWDASPGASGYRIDVGTNVTGGEAVTADVQGFEGESEDTWNYSAIGATTTTDRKRTGAYSLQFTGATASATFDPVALPGTSAAMLNVAFSANGPDLNEDLYLSICTRAGGVLSSNTIALVNGYANADVAFNATNAANPTTVSPNPYSVAVSATATQVYVVVYAVGLDSGDSYYVDDVSLTSITANYVPGYSNRAVAGTSQSVTGLVEDSTYYFVVRAEGAGGCTSANSPTGTVTTPVSICVPGKVAMSPVQTNQCDATFTAGTAGMTNASDAMHVLANGTGGYAAVWKTLRTSSGTGGSARPLQIGDEFSIDLTTHGVYYGQLGLSLNRGGSTGSWANRTNGLMASVRQDGENYGSGGGIGSWYAADSGTASFANTPSGKSDYTVKFKITSSETYSVDLNGTTKYDRSFANSPGTNDRIDAFSVFLNDDRSSAAGDRYNVEWWTAAITNLGAVEFGADGGTRTISGLIADGVNPKCPDTPSPNRLIKSGDGTITLANTNNTYTLDTVISGGTLAISGDGCLGTPPGSVSNAHIKLIDGGGLEFAINDFTLNANRGIAISGTNGNLGVVNGRTATYDGVITDEAESRAIIINAGTNQFGELILGGSNTYDGGTYIDHGKVTINHPNALGPGPVYVGADPSSNSAILKLDNGITLTNAVTMRQTAGVGSAAIQGSGTLSGGMAMMTGEGGHLSSVSTSLTVSGTISGGGGGRLNIGEINGGTIIITGTNTHDKQVYIDRGTLSISASRNLGEDPSSPYADKITLDGGKLHATASFAVHSYYLTVLEWKGGDNTIEVDPACSLSYPAAISGVGTLVKTGEGTLRLTGENTFTNTLTISSGTVQIGTNGTAGSLAAASIVNNAVLVWHRWDDTAYAGAISGSGTLTKNGAGVLTLSGSNTYAGGTYVDAGYLTMMHANALGTETIHLGRETGSDLAVLRLGAAIAVTNALSIRTGSLNTKVIHAEESATLSGAVAINETSDTNNFWTHAADGKTLTLSGTMSGTGGGTISKSGAGTVIFSGTNTHDKKIAIHDGTLSISASRNLGADPDSAYPDKITLDGGTLRATASFAIHSNYSTTLGWKFGGTIEVDPTYTLTYPAMISGTGTLEKTGTGTLTLTGDNTFTGDLTINGGRVVVGAGGSSGSIVADVVNAGALVFNRSDASEYAGAIFGSGSVTNLAGALTLSGENFYDGPTSIRSGTLIVSGSAVNSAVTVWNGATIKGDGAVGTLTVSNNATVAPGDKDSWLGSLAVAALDLKDGAKIHVKIGDVSLGTIENRTDRDCITNSGSFSIAGTTTIYIDDAQLANWITTTDHVWTLIDGGIAATNGFALDASTYWSTGLGEREFVLVAEDDKLKLVYDDDVDVPLADNVNLPGADPFPFVVATNGKAMTDLIRGFMSRRTGTGTNAVHYVTDAELASSGEIGLQFVVGARDVNSGVSRGDSGSTNTVMNLCLGNVVSGNCENYNDGLSTVQTTTNQCLTNFWTFDNGDISGAAIADLMLANQPVRMTVPDADNDRANDRSILHGQQAGLLRVVDDDIRGPLISSVSLEDGLDEAFFESFESATHWEGSPNSGAWSTNVLNGPYVASGNVTWGSLDPKVTGTKRIGLLTNVAQTITWLELPPVSNPGLLTLMAGRFGAEGSGNDVEIRLDRFDSTTWTSLGGRTVTNRNPEFSMYSWNVDSAGTVTMRLVRATTTGPQVYVDDISVMPQSDWISTNQLKIVWTPAADDFSAVADYRLVVPGTNTAAPTAGTEGEVARPNTATNATLDISGADRQGVLTGYLFANDDDQDRPDDGAMGNVRPIVVKVDRTPPTPVPLLENGVSTEAVDDPTTQFDVRWNPAGVGPDWPQDGQHPTGQSGDTGILSPWRTFKIYYGIFDPLEVPGDDPPWGNGNAFIYTNFIASGAYRAWSNVVADSPIADPLGAATNYLALTNAGCGGVRLYDLDYDREYVVVIVGVDRAGNEGPAGACSWATNNTIKFALTCGWTLPKTDAAAYFPNAPTLARPDVGRAAGLAWLAAGSTNVQSTNVGDRYLDVLKEYDLIYLDAPTFAENTNNEWLLLGTVRTNWFVDDGGLARGRGQMRFYRASYKNRWQRTRQVFVSNEWIDVPQKPLASEEVYALHNVVLSPGQNFVAFHGEPYANTLGGVFGGTETFPGGSTMNPASGATVVEFFSAGTNAPSVAQYWLGTNGAWKDAAGDDITHALQPSGFFSRGFSIHLPPATSAVWNVYAVTNAVDCNRLDANQRPVAVPALIWAAIAQVPTNPAGFSQTIQCGSRRNPVAPVYNVVALRLPVAVHPSQMKLLECGFVKGNKGQSDEIYTMDTARKDVMDGSTIYCDASGIWRFVGNNGLVPWGYFKPNDVIVVVSKNGGLGHSWSWTYRPSDFYPLPTRWMGF